MAATARRIGLSTRSARKTSRDEESGYPRTRKPGFARKISREECTNNPPIKKLSRSPQEGEIYCSPDIFERSQNNKTMRKLSRPEGQTGVKTGVVDNQPRRKISVYARPDSLERKVNPKIHQSRWMELLIRCEPFILSFMILLIVFVSIYIVFVERQSLFGNGKQR